MFCPEHPKRDQNLKFTPLGETTSIPAPFIWEFPPRGWGSEPKKGPFHRGNRYNDYENIFPGPNYRGVPWIEFPNVTPLSASKFASLPLLTLWWNRLWTKFIDFTGSWKLFILVNVVCPWKYFTSIHTRRSTREIQCNLKLLPTRLWLFWSTVMS